MLDADPEAIAVDQTFQYLSINYTERLAGAGLVPSVGNVGDSYDYAFAEAIKGLYKAEIIHRSRAVAVNGSRRVRNAGMGR